MRRFLFTIACILWLPLSAQAAVVEEPDDADDPDATDTSQFEQPKNLPPAATVSPVGNGKSAPSAVGETEFNEVVLRGLNKVTARAQTLEATIGSVVRFGTIEIIAHKCWKSAPEDRPENAALLEISEIKQGEPPTRIFLGWMFSSSPALSALENPFYDVSVVRCEKKDIKD